MTDILDAPVRTLRGYQSEAVDFLTRRRRAILADDPGTGKTPVTLTTLSGLREISRILVIAPLSVARHWEDEAAKWFPGCRVHVAVGSSAVKLKTIREAIAATEQVTSPVLVVTNYETVRTDACRAALRAFKPLGVILDEAHRVKERRSKTFQAVRDMCYGVPVLYALTGTPILNRVEELWSLLHLVDPKRWSSYWGFVAKYAESEVKQFPNGSQPIRIVKGLMDGMDVVLRQALRDVMIRRERADVLPELPPITYSDLRVDLSPAERKAYDQMAKLYFTSFTDADGKVTQVIAPNEVAKITRLRQLAEDVTVLDPEAGPSTKMRALCELIEDLHPEPVVVFSSFSKVVDQIARHSPYPVARITGDIPESERRQVVEAFQEGKIPVVAGTIRAMSEGINLFRSRHVVFLDSDWTPARNEQAIARVQRYGQTADAVVVYRIIARNTIDQYVHKILATKRGVIDSVVGSTWREIAMGGGE